MPRAVRAAAPHGASRAGSGRIDTKQMGDVAMAQVLIVDDSAPFRASLRALLERRFPLLAIEEAASARDALRFARDCNADLAFVDVRLPDGSGLDVTRALVAAWPGSTICVITSFDLPEYRRAADECGARYFFAKGTSTSAELTAVVEGVVASCAP